MGCGPNTASGRIFWLTSACRRASRKHAPQKGQRGRAGPGLGALTRPLLAAGGLGAGRRARPRFGASRSRKSWQRRSRGAAAILETDAKTVDFVTAFAGRPKPHVIAGNLPYQITGPLRRRPCTAPVSERGWSWCSWRSPTGFLQRRAASLRRPERVRAARLKVERAFVVRRGAFYPRQTSTPPSSLSSRAAPPPIGRISRRGSRRLRQRRKTLKNAGGRIRRTRGGAGLRAARAGIELSLRGRTLSVAQFERMRRSSAREAPALLLAMLLGSVASARPIAGARAEFGVFFGGQVQELKEMPRSSIQRGNGTVFG